MAKSATKMRAEAREKITNELLNIFLEQDEDVGMCKSNAFNLPIVLEDGTEAFAVVTVSIPLGGKDDEYDGYAEREDYTIKLANRQAKLEKKSK